MSDKERRFKFPLFTIKLFICYILPNIRRPDNTPNFVLVVMRGPQIV